MWLFIFIGFITWAISMLMTLDAYTKANQPVDAYNFWTSSKQYLIKYPQYFMISFLLMVMVIVFANLDLLSYVLQNIFGLTDIMNNLPQDTLGDLNYRFNVFGVAFLGFNIEYVVGNFRRRNQPLTKI